MRSLRSQLSFTIMFIMLVVFAFVSVLANWAVNKQFEAYIMNQEQARRNNIQSDLSNQYNETTQSWDSNYLHTIGMYSLYDGYMLTIYDASGKIIWDAENHDMTLCKEIMNDISKRMSQRKSDGGFTSHTYAIERAGQAIGSVSISSYGPYFFREDEFEFINTLNATLLIIGLISCVFSVAAGQFLARFIARPITKTAEIAKQISKGNYMIRFESDTKTKELSNLISSINYLANALDRQERYRKQLTSDVAHELRTPLTAIRSYLEAMTEGLWEATPERLKGCLEEVKRLGNLVADLERLAKIESENMQLNKSEVDLLEVVNTVSSNFEIEAHRRNISIEVSGTSSCVWADKDRMSQVITNLLSNAIKYTQFGGHVSIKVKDSNLNVKVIVEDDGIGIPSKDIPLIFERFYRTDRSRSRETGGAGIGLAIAQSIVEAHDGSISAESQENKGSRFIIVLPKNI